MTRARARAIENEVTSLLSELTHSTCETWLLPQTETLCVIRYLEEGRAAATTNGQDGEDAKREEQEGELPGNLQPPDDRHLSDVRRLEAQPTRTGRPASTGRPTPSSDRTPDRPRKSGTASTEPKRRKSEAYRTADDRTSDIVPKSDSGQQSVNVGSPKHTGRPDPLETPDDR
jgi:hypothetical protein